MAKPAAIKKVAESSKVCLLVYGHPGVQKTRFVGSGPDKTLIVRPPTEHTDSIRGTKMDEWVVHDWDDMNAVLEYVRHEGAQEYDWVWLDSISLFQDTGLDDIWANVVRAKPHRAEWGLDQGEYGRNMERLARWVRHMVGTPGFNFGITAHPLPAPDPANDDELLLMPWVQGKQMIEKVCGYMNIVAYLEERPGKGDKEPYRLLHTRKSGSFYAKDQFNSLPKGKMRDPTLPKMVDAIRATGSEASASSAKKARKRITTTKKGS